MIAQKTKKEEAPAASIAEEIDDFEEMFNHKSKLSSLVPENRIAAYKKMFYLIKQWQDNGEVPMHPDGNYLGNNELAEDIYKKKYYLKNLKNKQIETRPEQTFRRLAAYIAAVEENPEKQPLYSKKFYNILYNGHFMPGGRVIAGGGDLFRLKTLANCFVTIIESDNIESIYKTAYECARTYSFGGGIGVDMSVLRPKNSVVHNAADHSTGAVSFMDIYSLTTGLIGQAGRRGALMLTIDVKHPDVFNFIHVKKVPNWVTRQIVEQCRWSNKFSEEHLEEIEKQVRENTQVRFANISLKVSDEFMNAVEEQTKYGKDKILVYKKNRKTEHKLIQDEKLTHYAFGIPSKDVEDYELIGSLNDTESANMLLNPYGLSITDEQIDNTAERDAFGDLVLKPEGTDFEITVRRAGDFMLYFHSQNAGEIKELVKARDIWDPFVGANYKTAEPGLIFWSKMKKYSPSNYVGKPIISTNPCVTGDSLISTCKGLVRMNDLTSMKHISVVTDNRVPLEIRGADSIQLLKQKAGMSIDVIERAFCSGKKETLKLETKYGYEITATPEHKIMTQKGWKQLGELSTEDKILIQGERGVYNPEKKLHFKVENEVKGKNGRKYLFNFSDSWSEELGELLGWIIGDGFLTKEPDNRVGLVFGKGDENILDKIKLFVEKIYGKPTKTSKRESSYQLRYHSKYFADFLRNLGIKSCKAEDKRVPEPIFTATHEAVRGFLRGLFSADGTISVSKDKGKYVRLTSKSKQLLKEVQLLLINEGILSRIYSRHRKPRETFKYTTSNGEERFYVSDGVLWELQIGGSSGKRFLREIGFLCSIHWQKTEFFLEQSNYQEHFFDKIKSIKPNGIQEVFDLTEPRTHSFIANGIVVSNCGEVPLEDGGACNLGSINLSRLVKDGFSKKAEVDWKLLEEVIYDSVRFLDNVVFWNETLNPLEKQRKSAKETRRVGLGVMGVADMFLQLGIEYDSNEGVKALEEVIQFIANHAYKASAELAAEKGQSSIFDYDKYKENPFFNEALSEETKRIIKEKGLRNIALLSIAPTGTISNVALSYVNGKKHYIGVSGGIEPVFAMYYTRRSESFGNKLFKVFHSTVKAYLDKERKEEEAQKAEDLDALKKVLPTHFFRTAHFIKPESRVIIQGAAQKYIDHSISSTVNLPESIDPETISNIYLQAWKNGLKGITIYRDGSRSPILSVQMQQTEFQGMKDKKFRVEAEGAERLTLKGEEVFTTPQGMLSTPFHALKNSIKGVKISLAEEKIAKKAVEEENSTKANVCKIEVVDGNLIKTCSE